MRLRDRLEEARRREKAQTLFYRALASAAEEADDTRESETLNELHADEQHHLSRLTARLLEMGADPADLRDLKPDAVPALAAWREHARRREAQEVSFYEALLAWEGLDEDTRPVIHEILEAERQHHTHLGGKWMSA